MEPFPLSILSPFSPLVNRLASIFQKNIDGHFSVADERLRRHFNRFDPRHKHLPTVIVYTKIGALSTAMGRFANFKRRERPAVCKR